MTAWLCGYVQCTPRITLDAPKEGMLGEKSCYGEPTKALPPAYQCTYRCPSLLCRQDDLEFLGSNFRNRPFLNVGIFSLTRRAVVRDGHLGEARVREPREQRRLRPHGLAVLRVVVELLFTNREQVDLRRGLFKS